MRKLFLLALMAAAFSGNTEAQAESKHVLNYQGTIKITNGSELKNQVTMNFKIYDAPVGGKLLWQEDQRTVNIKDGFFNVYIGEMQSDLAERVDFSKPVYLEITVDNEVLPRTLISASPY